MSIDKCVNSEHRTRESQMKNNSKIEKQKQHTNREAHSIRLTISILSAIFSW